MERIMFICHGNICRSPMAEYILKDMVKSCGREAEFVIASCATSTEEIYNGIGNPVYPPAKAELLKHGLSCDGKRATQLQKDDYQKFDLFLCMDSANVRNAIRILGGDKDNKVRKLLPDRDVADPWYSRDFGKAFNDIYEGCSKLLKEMSEQTQSK